uniref:Uncharacterized protein n=1 Tax=Monopterus albus TaxID=43700 RepID=A0A3Q3QMQ2_MONAL
HKSPSLESWDAVRSKTRITIGVAFEQLDAMVAVFLLDRHTPNLVCGLRVNA